MRVLANTLILLVVATASTACTKSAFDPGIPDDPALDMPSTQDSHMAISEGNVADGITPATITLTLRNFRKMPLVGKKLTLQVYGGSGNVIVPCTASNAQGIARCWLYSTGHGWKRVRAHGVVDLSGDTEFIAVRPFRSAFAVVTSGDVDRTSYGHKMVSTSGISELEAVQKDANQKMRAFTSVQGSIIGD